MSQVVNLDNSVPSDDVIEALSLNLSVLLPRPCARIQSLSVRRSCAYLYQIDNILVERIAGPSLIQR